MFRLLILLLLLGAVVPAFAQDDGRLYNPPGLEMRGWLDRDLDTDAPASSQGNSSTVVVERVAQEIVQPLLPMVFFNVGMSRLPARYRLISSPAISGGYTDTASVLVKMSQSSFGEDPLSSEGAAKYYELIDIVGCRLRRFPDAHLSLRGGYSAEPGESAELANLRATSVRDHLVTMWGIAPDRIELLPAVNECDSTAQPIRQEEARNVLFLSDDPRVLLPVHFNIVSTRDMMLNLQFTIIPRFDAQDIRDLELSVAVGDGLVFRNSLPVSRDSSSYHLHGITPIMWALDDPSTLSQQVVAQVVVTLNDGRRFLSNEAKLAFTERRTPRDRAYDSPLLEYEVPFFDWRDTTITARQAPMLAEMMRNLDSIFSVPATRARDSIYHVLDSLGEESRRSAETESVAMESANATMDSVLVATASEGPGRVDSVEIREPDSSVRTDEPAVVALDNAFAMARKRSVIDRKPQIVISAGVDMSEGFEAEALHKFSAIFSAQSEGEAWREIGTTIMRSLTDRSNPPRMLIVEGDEIDDKLAQMTWLGFDVEQQMQTMMAEQQRRMEKIATSSDSTLFDSDGPVAQLAEQRMRELVRGRVLSMHNLLLRSGFCDTVRMNVVLDTNDSRYSRAFSSRMRGGRGVSMIDLPEKRYMARMTTITLRLEEQASYQEAMPVNYEYQEVQPAESVPVEPVPVEVESAPESP